jgi:hypothetical protein
MMKLLQKAAASDLAQGREYKVVQTVATSPVRKRIQIL